MSVERRHPERKELHKKLEKMTEEQLFEELEIAREEEREKAPKDRDYSTQLIIQQHIQLKRLEPEKTYTDEFDAVSKENGKLYRAKSFYIKDVFSQHWVDMYFEGDYEKTIKYQSMERGYEIIRTTNEKP